MNKTEEEIDEIISKTVSRWFYSAPVLYKTICKNPIVKNKNMSCAARSGKSRIEYNPDKFAENKTFEIKQAITLEISRILLGHCTKRRPEPFDPEIAIEASNIAILQHPLRDLPPGESFEFYYRALMERENQEEEDEDEESDMSFGGGEGEDGGNDDKGGGDSGKEGASSENDKSAEQTEAEAGNSSQMAADATELWNEDDEFEELCKENELRDIVTDEKSLAESSSQLPGSVAGNLEMLLRIGKPKLRDKIKVAKIFMSSVTGGSKRVATRSKPNRRTGFIQMGSKRRKGKIKLFCVVDVSGSVPNEWVQRYVAYINYIRRKYKSEIDLIQADTELKFETLRKVKSQIKAFKVRGRGGTNFDCVYEYLAELKGHKKYDGVIIFTDGCVAKPKIPKGLRVRTLWALSEKSDYFEEQFKGERFIAYLD